MEVDGTQQNDVSEPDGVLSCGENMNNNFELGNNVVDDAKAIDNYKPISPMKDGIGVSEIRNGDLSYEAEGLDISSLISPINDVAGLSKSSTTEIGSSIVNTSKLIFPNKDEDATLFKSSSTDLDSSMKYNSDDHEKTNRVKDGGNGFDNIKMTFPLKDEINASDIRTNVVTSGLEDCTVEDLSLTVVNVEGLKNAKKSSVPRERRRSRSKYLSPPFVNLREGSKDLTNSTESKTENSCLPKDGDGNSSVSDKPALSPSVSKPRSKRGERKSSRKSFALLNNILEISAKSSELLSELHLAALDCLYPFDNKLFVPTKVFFARFRASVYNSGESNSEVDGKNTSSKIGSLNESKSQPKKRKKREVKTAGSDSALTYKPQNLLEGNSTGTECGSEKKKEEEKTITGTTNVGPTSIGNHSKIERVTGQVLDVPNKHTAFIIDFSKETMHATSSSLEIPQETKQTTVLCFERKEEVRFPDLNDQSAPGCMPGPKKRGRPKKVVSFDAMVSSDSNPEKKRRRRCKDGTYKDEMHAGNSMTKALLANGKNAKPISLEVCLRNVGMGPYTPVPHPNVMSTPPRSMQPVNGLTNSSIPKSPATPGGPLSIDQIRKNLEFMTTMLQKSGDNLNAETKAKLEIEIQGLMKKVSAHPGSSCS